MNIKKIIYVSGTRADYGLMRLILKRLDRSDDMDISICVTGMHLSPLYGNTIREIEDDGFKISGIIPVDVNNTTHRAMSQSIGYEIIGMTEVFAKEQPDLIIILGDRGEMLAAAIAAVHLNIPIIHLHGGERSGTVDEMVRHAISKLSHFHFVATEASKERLIKMGEKEDNIYLLGAPGLEQLHQYKNINHAEFCKLYQFNQNRKIALFLYHPVVQEYDNLSCYFTQAIEAALASDLQLICLEPNSDAGGQIIRKVLQRYENHKQICIIKHLTRSEFINCLAHVDLMIGNSSSGIIEAATFNLCVVNIGSRQNMRECSDNVIHTDTTYDAILAGIKFGLSQKGKNYTNVYGGGAISEKCYQLIKSINLSPNILNKCNAY